MILQWWSGLTHVPYFEVRPVAIEFGHSDNACRYPTPGRVSLLCLDTPLEQAVILLPQPVLLQPGQEDLRRQLVQDVIHGVDDWV